MVNIVKDLSVEHILMFVIVAFLLYHLIGGCSCGIRSRDGFNVGGKMKNKNKKDKDNSKVVKCHPYTNPPQLCPGGIACKPCGKNKKGQNKTDCPCPTDPKCSEKYNDEKECNEASECAWCTSGDVPGACNTLDNAKTLPPSIFTCEKINDPIPPYVIGTHIDGKETKIEFKDYNSNGDLKIWLYLDDEKIIYISKVFNPSNYIGKIHLFIFSKYIYNFPYDFLTSLNSSFFTFIGIKLEIGYIGYNFFKSINYKSSEDISLDTHDHISVLKGLNVDSSEDVSVEFGKNITGCTGLKGLNTSWHIRWYILKLNDFLGCKTAQHLSDCWKKCNVPCTTCSAKCNETC
jgi:hypothetical protein